MEVERPGHRRGVAPVLTKARAVSSIRARAAGVRSASGASRRSASRSARPPDSKRSSSGRCSSATINPSRVDRAGLIARRAADAIDQASDSSARGTVGPSAAVSCLGRCLQLRPRPGRTGDEGAADAANGGGERVG